MIINQKTVLTFVKKNLLFIVLGLVIGLITGAFDMVFGRVLLLIGDVRTEHPLFFIPFLGLAGLVILYLYQHYGGRANGGMGLVFRVGHGKEQSIPKRLIPLIILTTWLTHLFGGSAGREGVAVQIGATISNFFTNSFDDANRRLFLITGMAAGFAGLFQTPLAATLFAIEVLFIGRMRLSALVPVLVASYTASATSQFLGLEHFAIPIKVSLAITPILFMKLAVLGLLFGLTGNAFALGLKQSKKWLADKLPNAYLRIVLIGSILALTFLLLDMGRYSGLGTNLISASFSDGSILSYDWLLKLVLTLLTLAIGFQGGEVTPLFAIGSSLGVVLAPIFGLPISLVAALGYASVFGSATSTFLAPILIGAEVFGMENFPYFFIVMVFTMSFGKRNSIYGEQKY
ncbi:chloride channel protein [Streptococcus zalophi]|uniref:Chloride channel protein n=1 Tax=Streptococcus zalophi TaxID=640031 RepID=A0A934UDC4_9STRE|nr:chloride channel protein [Streptococcus zalophi]MBJ8349652.1 chloride channel protein [Streptococcus zalophi]MCR8967999.1 chloride channel protein [Streptococcus zalophi]